MYLIISDTHIGDRHSDKNLEKLYRLLDFYSEWKDEMCLILNGDIIDIAKEPEFDSRHFIFFHILRKFKYIYYVTGNHDWAPTEVKDRVPEIEIVNELRFKDGNQRIVISHGHEYDWTITNSVWLSRMLTKTNKFIDDCISLDIQRLFHRSSVVQNHMIPTQIKKFCSQEEDKATMIVCGHTHRIEICQLNGLMYYNTGSWTDKICAYLTIKNGNVALSRV